MSQWVLNAYGRFVIDAKQCLCINGLDFANIPNFRHPIIVSLSPGAECYPLERQSPLTQQVWHTITI